MEYIIYYIWYLKSRVDLNRYGEHLNNLGFQLYYDEQLGRWVDKNAPDEGENKPPPPPMIPKGKLIIEII